MTSMFDITVEGKLIEGNIKEAYKMIFAVMLYVKEDELLKFWADYPPRFIDTLCDMAYSI